MINWKARAKKLEDDLAALHERAKEVGFSLVKERDAHRRAANDLMTAERRLARAVAAIDSATETFAAHGLSGHAATFRIISHDLRSPRAGVQDEQDEQV
jgi:hypothetical protein